MDLHETAGDEAGETKPVARGVPLVRAVERAMAILRALGGRAPLTLAEVAQSARLDKGTCRRILLTLMGGGFVVQDAVTQRYGLGRAIQTLASSVVENADIRSIAAPELTQLATELQVTSFLSIYHQHAALCLDRYHDMKGLEVRWWAVGGNLPLNCGGAPKLLLAHQPAAEIERALAAPFVALTAKSILEPEKLRRRLATIRSRGFELAIDDVALGLTALAVPVKSPSGEVLGAISIAGLTPQMAQRGKPLHLGRLLEAARRIERQLG